MPIASARRSPTSTTAVAPSPNSPDATRFGVDASSFWTVSEHSSTDSSTATSSGWPTRWSCRRAMPAAPATQPSPNTGTRFTSSRRPRRATSRASMLGAPIPVTVTDITTSTSAGVSPAPSSAWRTAASARSTPTRRNASLEAVNPSSSAYSGRASARCRVRTPVAAWNLRSTPRWAGSGTTIAPKASVIWACG